MNQNQFFELTFHIKSLKYTKIKNSSYRTQIRARKRKKHPPEKMGGRSVLRKICVRIRECVSQKYSEF